MEYISYLEVWFNIQKSINISLNTTIGTKSLSGCGKAKWHENFGRYFSRFSQNGKYIPISN
jgi:hypothetical protein